MNLKLNFICVQPATLYYAWQVEVMLTNFRDCGICQEYKVQCLFAYNKNEHDWQDKVALIKKLAEKFKNVADIHFYEDTRKYPISYISSIRPNILKQHFKAYPELSKEAVFYHDCDIVFTKYPDFFEQLLEDDMNWYVSDTKSYISHSYIRSKGEDVLNKMCDIVGINPSLVASKEQESGGAQYLLKGLDWRFFEKMESDCEILFKEITELNNQKKKADPNHHELQIWCADMWAILWGAWMRGYTTKIIPELNFCWATDRSQRWHEVYIFHNAGVTSENKNLFNKSNYTTQLPYFDSDNHIDRQSASFKYFSIIKQVANETCLKQDFNDDFLNLNVIKRAHARFLICTGCENFITTSTGTKMCKKCACQTEKKIVSDDPNDCPEKKWII